MELAILEGQKFADAVKLAETLSRSSVVPAHFRGKGSDVFAAIIMGAELGFQPMTALNSFVNINGTTAPKAQAMLSLAKAKLPNLIVEIKESKTEVSVMMKLGENNYTSTWTDERASAMGLLGKDNYKKQKITMYKWRAISDCLKVICPHILNGFSMYEELVDIEQAAPIGSAALIEEDFPIPPEEKEVGPLYRIQNGKFRSKQFKDLTKDELYDLFEMLDTRKNLKPWEVELRGNVSAYLVQLKNDENSVITSEVLNGIKF